MNKNNKLLLGIGALAILYFVFRKKGTTTKSTSTNSSKVEGGTISVDEKEILDSVKSKTTPQAGDSPKVVAIKKFFAEITTNPPKSEQDFLARASKAGLSKADLQTPEAQKIMNPFASFNDYYNSVGDARKKRASIMFMRNAKKDGKIDIIETKDGQRFVEGIDFIYSVKKNGDVLTKDKRKILYGDYKLVKQKDVNFLDFDSYTDVQANIM